MVGTRIFVGNLPSNTSERDLERFFRGYGRMREVLLKNGYGFVEFDDRRDAEDAVYELNGKKLLGVRVTVEKARGTPRGRDQYGGRERDRDYPSRDYRGRNERYGPPTRTAYRLIVENLSSRVSWQDLKDFMRQAGEVTYADAHKKRRNEGVVEFASSTDMKNALETLNNSDLNGRYIKLVEDRKRHSRSSSYSSRSRSRSGSRKSRSSSRSRSPKKSPSRKKVEDDTRRSRSRSNHKGRSDEERSRSRSRPKSLERSRSKSRSPRRSKSRSNSRRPKSEERRASRSRSRSRSHQSNNHREPVKSRSRSKSRHASRSVSPRSRSRSHSRSRSCD